jgi:signal transduction histidine kinase
MLATAGVGAGAVLGASERFRAPVAWCAGAATLAVAVVAAEAARRGRALRQARRAYAELERETSSRFTDVERASVKLAEQVLPAAVARIQRGEFVTDVLDSVAAAEDQSHLPPEIQRTNALILSTVLEAVANEEDLRDSAQRAFVNIARRVQAIVHQQALDLREMEDRHGREPAFFADLLHLDHGNALVGRLADSIAVLGGARPGRQWSKPVPLFSVLRGAMSRILDYQRVDLHSVTEVAVVGPSVEPLIHAVAELLDNATRYSPPQTRVHLTATEVQSGIAIEIEDGGVSLSAEGRARAERMLREAQEGIDLNDLGESPRLGLAVVGRLSREYKFQVSLRTSAYGGVRAVLIVPQDVITTAPAPGRAHGIGATSGPRPAAGSRPAPRPGAAAPAIPPRRGTRRSFVPAPAAALDARAAVDPRDQEEAPPVTERTPTGLPQRRRRSGAAPTPAPVAAIPTAPAPAEDSVQPGMWLAAFHNAVKGTDAGQDSNGGSAESDADASALSDKGEQL